MSGIPDIQTEYSEIYRKIIVTGIFGGIIPGGIEAIIYSDEKRPENALKTEPLSPNKVYVKRVIEANLIIDPLEMKSIYNWLGAKIKEYESLFGNIPSPEELESKVGRGPGR